MDTAEPFRSHRVRTLVVAVAMILVGVVGLAGPASAGYYTSYNPCPYYQPYQHCNAYGSCYCSQYP